MAFGLGLGCRVKDLGFRSLEQFSGLGLRV